MRRFIKGFVYFGLTLAAFAGGFGAPSFQSLLNRPAHSLWRMHSEPPALLSLAVRPQAVRADTPPTLPPTETYFSVMNTIRQDFYNGQEPVVSAINTSRGKPSVTTREPRVAPRRLTYAAIDGMLATLKDRYTEYWTPEEYRANMEETRGNFVGIGASLDETKEGRAFILRPIENSPASRAGLLPGDFILAINDKSVAGFSISEVVDRIRGKEGTTVRLLIERKNSNNAKPFTVTLVRSLVQAPVIESRLLNEDGAAARIGYIKLDMFTEQANRQFGRAVAGLERQNMRALIFDMRDNPGGLLNVAQEIASRFLDKGPVVWVREKNGRMSSLDVEANQHQGKLATGAYPIIVLVNGNSASASEIVCGAIQDAKRGQILGTRTFGKGLVQTIIPLGDESAVKITTQHYYTRDKHDINRRTDSRTGEPIRGSGGVLPDFVVEFNEREQEKQRDALRADPRNATLADRHDPQIRRAVELLREKLGLTAASVTTSKKLTVAAKKETAQR